MNKTEIEVILDKHEKWIRGVDGGKRAELRGADLRRADLRRADLRRADLRRANLDGANLCAANLDGADLYAANLYEANLYEADLRRAYLRRANLLGANLCAANLDGADLDGANLWRASINAKTRIRVRMSCPTQGEFIGWKKVENKIVKLKIPEDAKRCSGTSSKCRCDKAFVLEIQEKDGTTSELKEILNSEYSETKYRVGEMVYPDSFDDNRWNECSHGIHFFIDRDEAVNY